MPKPFGKNWLPENSNSFTNYALRIKLTSHVRIHLIAENLLESVPPNPSQAPVEVLLELLLAQSVEYAPL